MTLIPASPKQKELLLCPFLTDEHPEAQRGEATFPGHTAPSLRELTAHRTTSPLPYTTSQSGKSPVHSMDSLRVRDLWVPTS